MRLDNWINHQYLINKTLLDTQGIKIYECLINHQGEITYFNVHRIAHRPLLKYYLEQLETFKATLPYRDSFVMGSELYLVFEIKTAGLPIDHRSFNAKEKMQHLLSLLAKLALDDNLSNFLKWSLINKDCLLIDNNGQLHLNVYLDLLNPNNFSDFIGIQSRLADFCESLFEDEDPDLPVFAFIDTCRKGNFENYKDMLATYKKLIETPAPKEEPMVYTKLYQIFLWLKQHQKRLIFTALIFLVLYVAYDQTYGSKPSTEQAFVKTEIGQVTYKDPYSEPIEASKTITVTAPPVPKEASKTITPSPPAPKTTPTKTTTQTPAKPVPEYTTYVTKKGDFLVRICKKTYGDGKYAWVVAKYNGLKDPSYLKISATIKLPTKAKVEALYKASRK